MTRESDAASRRYLSTEEARKAIEAGGMCPCYANQQLSCPVHGPLADDTTAAESSGYAKSYLTEGDNLEERYFELRLALHKIAAPKRPDGTYNLSREACEQIAKEALRHA